MKMVQLHFSLTLFNMDIRNDNVRKLNKGCRVATNNGPMKPKLLFGSHHVTFFLSFLFYRVLHLLRQTSSIGRNTKHEREEDKQ